MTDYPEIQPCPICELGVKLGAEEGKKDQLIVQSDRYGNFAGADAVHAECMDQYRQERDMRPQA